MPLCAAEERSLKPKDVFKQCEQCAEMVVVPAGRFTMGSPDREKDRDKDEGPQRTVTIGKPFAAGKFHVAVDQFAAFVEETRYDAGSKCWTFQGGKWEEKEGRSWRNPGFSQAGAHPAVCVSWNDAKAYVDWLSKKTGKPYWFLSESEWEYAARARTEPGSYPRFWFGNDEKDLCRYGNGADQKARDSIEGAKGWTNAACNDGYAYTSLSEVLRRTALASTIRWETLGSGPRIATTTATRTRRRTDRRGQPATAVTGCYAAGPGATVRGTSAPPTAAGTPPASGTTISAFGWGGRLINS
jgi:hypothetical protein